MFLESEIKLLFFLILKRKSVKIKGIYFKSFEMNASNKLQFVWNSIKDVYRHPFVYTQEFVSKQVSEILENEKVNLKAKWFLNEIENYLERIGVIFENFSEIEQVLKKLEMLNIRFDNISIKKYPKMKELFYHLYNSYLFKADNASSIDITNRLWKLFNKSEVDNLVSEGLHNLIIDNLFSFPHKVSQIIQVSEENWIDLNLNKYKEQIYDNLKMNIVFNKKNTIFDILDKYLTKWIKQDLNDFVNICNFLNKDLEHFIINETSSNSLLINYLNSSEKKIFLHELKEKLPLFSRYKYSIEDFKNNIIWIELFNNYMELYEKDEFKAKEYYENVVTFFDNFILKFSPKECIILLKYVWKLETIEDCHIVLTKQSDEKYRQLWNDSYTEINESNWINITALYSLVELEESTNMPEEVKTRLKDMMEKWKDLVYEKMLELYQKLINKEELIKKEKILVDVLEKNWIWVLSNTETINNFIHYLSSYDEWKKENLLGNLAEIESNIKLDNESRNKLFFISNEFIKADLDLYNNLTELVVKASKNKSTFSKFLSEILPLYHTLLVLNQWTKWEYKAENLAYIKANIQAFSTNFENEWIFEKQKSTLKEQIKNKFQAKFWIIKVPEKIEEKEIETIKNLSLYLWNIADKNEEKEQIIWLILWLKLNNEWNNWREWKEIDLKSIFESWKIELYENLAKEMKEKSFLKDWGEIDKQKLQSINMSYIIWDVETIDLKLWNIAWNIEWLKDLDTYEDKKTKKLIQAYNFIKENNLEVNISAVLWKLFQWKELTEQEKQVEEIIWENLQKEEILELQKKNIWTKVITFLNNIEWVNIVEEIKELNKLKIPNQEIIDIFKKLWEEFSSDSWVIPIQSDINHLSEILSKGEKKLEKEEYMKAWDYLKKVNDKVTQLYALESKIKWNFDKFFFQIEDKNSQLWILANNLNNIINKDLWKWQKEIQTIFTNDIEDVIRNIRACLSCQTNWCNNDTNLSYLVDNKFFVYSKEHWWNRSIADQIVYLTKSNDEDWLFFLLDIVYWERVPDVLVWHIHNVMEKVRKLDKKEVSIFIPKSTMASCHLDLEHLKSKLKQENEKFEIIEKTKTNIVMQWIWNIENYQESLSWLSVRQSWLWGADWYEILFS